MASAISAPRIPSVPTTIGGLLVGWGLSCLILGIVFVQTLTYFNRYPNDSPYYKALVVSLVILETLHQAFVGHTAWYYNVANFGNPGTFFLPPVWSLSVQVVLCAFIGAIVKICYGMRVWKFSKGNVLVTSLIMASTIAQLACALVFTIKSFDTLLLNADKLNAIGTSCLSLGAATDIITALALSFFLHRLRTGYTQSDNLINRLIAHSVNTGMLTSLVSLTVVILYNVTPMNFVFISVYFVLAKLYSVSCLATLNSRRFISGKGTDNEAQHSPLAPIALSQRSKQQPSGHLQIGIHHEVSVTSDPSEHEQKNQLSSMGSVALTRQQAYYTTGW